MDLILLKVFQKFIKIILLIFNEKKDILCNESYDRLTNIIDIHNEYFYLPINVKLVKGDVNKKVHLF